MHSPTGSSSSIAGVPCGEAASGDKKADTPFSLQPHCTGVLVGVSARERGSQVFDKQWDEFWHEEREGPNYDGWLSHRVSGHRMYEATMQTIRTLATGRSTRRETRLHGQAIV